MSESDFIEKVKINFNLSEVDFSSPKERRQICMYLNKKWYLLTPNENVKKEKLMVKI